MSGSDEEIRATFEAMIAAMGGEGLTDQMAIAPYRGRRTPKQPPRSRHTPRADVVTLRVRVDLNGSRPPIWRRLDLRSDLRLDVVHHILQDAFGWTDSHLHRFTLSADPWDGDAEQYLCPYDVEEGDDGFSGAGDQIPEEQVRLDETLAEPGDVLAYVYDYGDNWELTLRLEDVRPHDDTAAPAVVVDGRRAAPPEDCGSLRTAEDLAEVLDDPARFDLSAANTALTRPYYTLRRRGFHPRLLNLLAIIEFHDPGNTLAADLAALPETPTTPSHDDLATHLRPHLWMLDRARDGGLPLTAAGYLKPVDVEALAAVLPTMADWIGKANREDLTAPVAVFRESMTRQLGLLRKYKGRLLPTRAGTAATGNPGKLYAHLADRLRPGDEHAFVDDANLLLLAYAAVTPNATLPVARIAQHLTDIGYRAANTRRNVEWHDLYHVDGSAHDTLMAISDQPARRQNRDRVSPVTAALAHAALRR